VHGLGDRLQLLPEREALMFRSRHDCVDFYNTNTLDLSR